MGTTAKYFISFVILAFITIILEGISFSADSVTVKGLVTEYNEIITDKNDVYYIFEDQKGNELADYFGYKVIVKGIIMFDEENDIETIKVATYQIIGYEEDAEDDLGDEGQMDEEEYEEDTDDYDESEEEEDEQ